MGGVRGKRLSGGPLAAHSRLRSGTSTSSSSSIVSVQDRCGSPLASTTVRMSRCFACPPELTSRVACFRRRASATKQGEGGGVGGGNVRRSNARHRHRRRWRRGGWRLRAHGHALAGGRGGAGLEPAMWPDDRQSVAAPSSTATSRTPELASRVARFRRRASVTKVKVEGNVRGSSTRHREKAMVEGWRGEEHMGTH